MVKSTPTTPLSTPRDENGVSIIAKPLAGEKLLKKTLKMVKKATKDKKIRRGVKEVQKAIRKKEKGICVIAGNVSPLDVISHFAGMCEEFEVPYIYVPSKTELGEAASTKRGTSVLMICPGKEWERMEDFKELEGKVKKETPSTF